MRSSINYPAKDVVLGVLEIAIGREAEKQGEIELLDKCWATMSF